MGYAATIIHFRGPGVSTAYYSDTTGIGTVYFEGGGGGNATVTIQDTAPSSPSAGDMWWESDTGELKIYYNDGNSSQWVDANGSDDNVFVSTTAPSSPIAGDLWFNSESGDLFVYYTDANTSQWLSVNASASRQYWSSNSTGISTTQYVGIGTTTATDALTVVGATDLDGRLLVSGFTTFTGRVTLDNGSNAGRDIQWQPSSDRLSWFDNTKATFGDGADLQIFHNNSDSVISQSASGTGNLKILSGGAQSIECVQAGAVKIAHNGNDKIETTSGGAKVTGDLQVTGVLTYEDVKNVDSVGIITARAGIHAKDDVTFYGATSGRDLLWDKSLNILNFKDNTAVKFGNDYDLSIYHNNSIGIIANSTGALTLLSDTIVLNNEANSAAQIQAISGASGYVKLFQNGDEKLATTSSGVTVTGDITISDSIIHTGDTNTKIRFPAADTITAETGGSEKLRITSAGKVGINTTVPAEKLSVSVDGNQRENFAKFEHIGQQNFFIQGQWGDRDIGGANGTLLYGSGTVALRAATSGDAHLVNLASGNIGIGTGVPVGNLEVRDTKANLIVAKDGLTVKSNSDLATQYDMIQLGAGGALASYSTATATADTQFIHNAYRHSGGNWKYRYADTAARLRVNSPARTWVFESAASGSADGDITWAEQLRIDSTGALGLGYTPENNTGNYRQLQIGLGAHFYGRTDDTPIYISSNAYRDGSNWKYTANTTASQMGMGTHITFYTASSGTAGNNISWTDAMRLENDGDWMIGSDWSNTLWDSGSESGVFYRKAQGSFAMATPSSTGYSNWYMNKNTGGGTSDNRWIDFYYNGTSKDKIWYNNSGNVAFGGYSDYRLKENITEMDDGIVKVKQLKPSYYTWKKGHGRDECSDIKQSGFIAHEIQSVLPTLVDGTKDQVVTQEEFDAGTQPEESTVGTPIYQSVDYQKITPILTAAIKELITKVETLEAEVAALKSG